MSAVDAVYAEHPTLACPDARRDNTILDINRFIADESAVFGDDGIGLAFTAVVDNGRCDVISEVTHLCIIGNVPRGNHVHVNDALILNTIGQILDVFRPKEIVSAIADKIGDINAYGAQRVKTITITGAQITVCPGQ